MVLKKVSSRKTAQRAGKRIAAPKRAVKQKMFKVTASYAPALPTAQAAKDLQEKVRQNPKAQVGAIKKSGSKFIVPFKFAFVTPTIAVRNKVASALKKSKYAKVTLGML